MALCNVDEVSPASLAEIQPDFLFRGQTLPELFYRRPETSPGRGVPQFLSWKGSKASHGRYVHGHPSHK